MNAEALIAKVPHLPAPTRSVSRLFALLTDANTDNDAVTDILRQDPVLSSKVLAVSNSVAFGLASPVSSLDEAMMFLGQREVHRIVMALSFGGALGPSLPGYRIDNGSLWRHSQLTALIAESVLRTVRTVKAEAPVAYTAGLIHDIGKLVISHALTEDKQTAVRELIAPGNISLVEAEREVIGVDHAQVGACLLSNWNLPQILIEAVAHHHAPSSTPNYPALSSIVHVADCIAHEVGSSPGFGSFAVRAEESAVEDLGLTSAHIEALILSAYDSAAKVDQTIAAS